MMRCWCCHVEDKLDDLGKGWYQCQVCKATINPPIKRGKLPKNKLGGLKASLKRVKVE